jgi:hypothetical protein
LLAATATFAGLLPSLPRSRKKVSLRLNTMAAGSP